MRLAEAARLIRVHPATLYRWIDNGTLPAYRVGAQRRVRRADVVRMVFVEPVKTPAKPTEGMKVARKEWETLRRNGLAGWL